MGGLNVPINMVLLGNDGHGKSSLGNFILNKITFPVTGNETAPIRRMGYSEGSRDNFAMKVVEMPACPDEPNDQLQAYREMISRANRICDHKLHLFLLVIKFDCANTDECLQIFDRWRGILGSDIFKTRGVIVITFGEKFKLLMEKNNTPDKKFSDWCVEQVKPLQNLIDECYSRCILFYNNAHTEDTFEELSNYMRQLSHTAYNFNESTKSQNNSSSWEGAVVGTFGAVVVGFLGILIWQFVKA